MLPCQHQFNFHIHPILYADSMSMINIDLKAIAPFVCVHPRCAAWAYGREDGKDFNTGAYGAAGGGVMFKALYLL